MTKNFAPIEIDTLLNTIRSAPQPPAEYSLHTIFQHQLGMKFNPEDMYSIHTAARNAPKGLMGYHTLSNGLTFCGMCIFRGDQIPIYFVVYWNGTSLQTYLPVLGNPWNDENIKATNEALEPTRTGVIPDLAKDIKGGKTPKLDFNPFLIEKDLIKNLLPLGKKEKTEKAVKPRRKKQETGQPDSGKTDILEVAPYPSLQQRVESLKYYGTMNEGYELFQATCSLCYKLYGLGQVGKAEIIFIWAQEMALNSCAYAQQDNTEADMVNGVWE